MISWFSARYLGSVPSRIAVWRQNATVRFDAHWCGRVNSRWQPPTSGGGFPQCRFVTSGVSVAGRANFVAGIWIEKCRQQGAADVSSAGLLTDSSAGKMPAAPCGSWKASFPLQECIETLNLTGKSKAPQGRRTPKPGGSARDCGQRVSVLECGGPPPLSTGGALGTGAVYGKPSFGFACMHWDLEPDRPRARPRPRNQAFGSRRRTTTRTKRRFMESPLPLFAHALGP
jgi:hypothetical protein